jgi:hypothetical protein
MRPQSIIPLLVLAALVTLLPGCPKPLELDKVRFQTIDLYSWGGPSYCVGRPMHLGVELVTPEGDRYRTAKKDEDGANRIPMEEFSFSALGADVDSEGFVIEHDPLATLHQPLEIQVSFRRDPRLEDDLSLAPRYDCETEIVIRGGSGTVGEEGARGEDGIVGEDGLADGPAGTGQPGEPGAAGDPGNIGGEGPEVEIAVGMITTRWHRLVVLVRVTRLDDEEATPTYHLLEAGASEGFVISVEGGAGGAGGAGGRGGNGGDGGNNTGGQPPGDGGLGGTGGDGGDGGDGGQGGTVHVIYDDAHPELVQWLRFSNPGGRGGRGGHGGNGGWGGRGGTSTQEKETFDGLPGQPGAPGRKGRPGGLGAPGPEISYTGKALDSLFGHEMAMGIQFK